MAKITTDFTGAENFTTITTRRKAIYDYYYGAGAYVAANGLSGVRAGMNDLTASDFANRAHFATWLARANYLNDPDNLRAEIGTFLSGTKGAYWDFTSAANVFEDTAATNPAEDGDVVQAITAYALGTATPMNFTHPSIGPTWRTTYAESLTAKGLSASANVLNVFRNVTVAAFACSFRTTSLSARNQLFGMPNNAGTTNRFSVSITTGGAVEAAIGNTADSAASTFTSTTGLITTDVDYTLIVTVDWGTGGAGAVRGYINNASDILNGTLGTGGTMADTAAASATITYGGASAPLIGRFYRFLLADKIPTAAERALIHGVLKGAYN